MKRTFMVEAEFLEDEGDIDAQELEINLREAYDGNVEFNATLTEKPNRINVTDMVLINKDELDKLEQDSLFLQCLRNGGVDNWDGWDYAVDEFNQWNHLTYLKYQFVF